MFVNDLHKLVLRVPEETADAVASMLVELVSGGLEQRDAETIDSPEGTRVTSFVVWLRPDAIEGCVASVQSLVASLSGSDTSAGVSWAAEAEDQQSWLESYKKYFPIQRIGKRTVIKPSWESYQAQSDELVVELDPGQAFGTGLHPSTRLVLLAIERWAHLYPAPRRVLDLGCGTAILAIAAAKLWPACSLLAVDRDETAVAVARENIRRNGLDERIQTAVGTTEQLSGKFDLIMANLEYRTLSGLKQVLRDCLDDEASLILSGLLAEQAVDISQLYTHDLMYDANFSQEEDNWRSLTLRVV